MTPANIIRYWREARSPVATERAIRAFLELTPTQAVRCAMLADHAGAAGQQRFLLTVEGYLSSPAMWRRQERALWRKRQQQLQNFPGMYQ